MTTERKELLTFLGAFVIALLCGFWTGRATAPTRMVTVERTREVKVAGETRVVTQTVESATSSKDVVRWRTRVVTRTDGTREETAEVVSGAERAGASATRASETEARVEYRDREVERRVEVTREASRWVLGARAGVRLDRTPVYGGEVGYRVLGPLELALTVDRPWAVVGALRWRF